MSLVFPSYTYPIIYFNTCKYKVYFSFTYLPLKQNRKQRKRKCALNFNMIVLVKS